MRPVQDYRPHATRVNPESTELTLRSRWQPPSRSPPAEAAHDIMFKTQPRRRGGAKRIIDLPFPIPPIPHPSCLRGKFLRAALPEVRQQDPQIGQVGIAVTVDVAGARSGRLTAEVGQQNAQVGQIDDAVSGQIAP